MQAVDMRRSYDGLHAIVQSKFTRDFRLGDYFIFINRCHERIKIFQRVKDRLTTFIKRLKAIASRHGPRVSGRKDSLRNGREASYLSPRNRCSKAQTTEILAQSAHPAPLPVVCAFKCSDTGQFRYLCGLPNRIPKVHKTTFFKDANRWIPN